MAVALASVSKHFGHGADEVLALNRVTLSIQLGEFAAPQRRQFIGVGNTRLGRAAVDRRFAFHSPPFLVGRLPLERGPEPVELVLQPGFELTGTRREPRQHVLADTGELKHYPVLSGRD